MGNDRARLRIGLIGAGLVGQAAHAHFLWDERERFDFVALADPSAAVRAAVGDRYAIPERHAALEDLLPLGLDAVVIGVPDAFHADVACQALAAGLHVLCEKPLALSVAECDRIAAARDASGRVLQVGTMKRFDPAYLRLLELLPQRAADVRYLSIEVRDPDQGPFVGHLPMTAASDLAPELGTELRARMASRIRDAAGGDPPAGAARAFEAYLSSLVHDVSLLQGVLERLGEPWCERADDGAFWDEGRAVSLSAALPGGGRAHLMHHNLPGVNDYSERMTLHCSDRVLELTFPSPYLRHEPTRLVEHRSDGAIGLRSSEHHVSYEEAFREELRAFAEACAGRAPVVTPVEAGRADVALLLDAYRHALARAAAATP
ncbi:MAG TPA: Gfo/Idh/MocA family oxidoreductase [Gaiellales bacterium]